MIKRLLGVWVMLAVLAVPQVLAHDFPRDRVQPEIRFAVLAHRPKPIAEAQWQPLIAYLRQAIPGSRFSLHTLNYKEMEAAVAAQKVDIVLTQPAFYVYLNARYGLSSPMATLSEFERGVPIRHFGAVIAVKHERSDLQKLGDLVGKRIVTPSKQSFGGYMMVAYEMQQAGLALPAQDAVIETGMPHDTAVLAVLEGKADAAFIRSGVLEDMIREGKLKNGQLRVVNQQEFPTVPFVSSTRLYPEWPVAAMSHVDDHVSNDIAAALLKLPHRGTVAKQVGIEGFYIPMDYRPVVEVLMSLRQPPYDVAPQFTWRDIWTKYAVWIEILVAMLVVTILLFVMLIRYNRRLGRLRQQAEDGDKRLRLFSALLPGVLFQYRLRPDGSAHYLYVSEAVRHLYGVTPEAMQANAQNLYDRVHPEDIDTYHARIRQSAQSMQEFRGEYRVVLDDGSVHWRQVSAAPQQQGDGSILWHGYAADIDERKQEEERMMLLVAALEASANGITITDLSGKIEWVNSAFCVLTGYSREELIGMNPRVLKSGLHDAAFYAEMWEALKAGKSWRGEIVNRRKDGSLIQEELIIAPVKNERGSIHHYIGVKQDIAARKRMEEELRKQATTDSLTGLPNRAYFFNRAEAEFSRTRRARTGALSVIMLDIDHFKRVNDTYGHQTGDDVLKHLAETLSSALRRSDCAGRLGGEEFVVLLPDTLPEQAAQLAERLREKIAGAHVPTGSGEIQYTASFGITGVTDEDASITHTINRADEALYRAKANGRNCVERG